MRDYYDAGEFSADYYAIPLSRSLLADVDKIDDEFLSGDMMLTAPPFDGVSLLGVKLKICGGALTLLLMIASDCSLADAHFLASCCILPMSWPRDRLLASRDIPDVTDIYYFLRFDSFIAASAMLPCKTMPISDAGA